MESKLAHQHKRFRCADHRHIRIAEQHFFQGRPVIGLHMVDHHIVKAATGKDMLQILEELAAR